LRSIRRESQASVEPKPESIAGLLSVVIPFYNLGSYLEETLKPFENLNEIPYELIVVDDGSNDRKSLEILTSLQEHYQFRIERTKNRGLATARNTGAQLARGEFLAFLDADDWMDPLFYPQALAILAEYENISFVGCWIEYFGEAKGYWPTWTPEVPYALVHNPLNTGALVYRRADFLCCGLNDPAFALVMEDYDSMLSMLEKGCRGVVVPEPYHKYRVRHDSMFHTISENSKIWTYQQLAQKHQDICSAFNEDIVGLMNANGPGYLFDNPTLSYPSLGYLAELNPSNGRLHEDDFARVPAATLFYYGLRSVFLKPYRKVAGSLPWLVKLAQKLKDELGQ
jgi:glycosyltransferase involved in cell wall biosynthesis